MIRKNIRRDRLDADDLAEKARINGVSPIKDINKAVLATNRDTSFFK